MKTERSIRFNLDTDEHYAVSKTLDIVTNIYEAMTPMDIIMVNENAYSIDDIGNIQVFLSDLWENGIHNHACEIKEN